MPSIWPAFPASSPVDLSFLYTLILGIDLTNFSGSQMLSITFIHSFLEEPFVYL